MKNEILIKKVYFAGSITGGRRDVEDYVKIIDKLKERFNVLSEFVGDKTLTELGEINMLDEDIYNRDVGMIEEADFVFAEVSQVSHGVGYEICYAESHGKPIFAVANINKTPRVSAMIVGNKNIKFFHYKDLSEVFDLIDSIE